jgi:hypothetical protein
VDLKSQRYGFFPARLNEKSKGIYQRFVLVINKMSFRILFLAKLVWNMDATIIDIENAFYHRNLYEEVHMNLSPGLDANENQKLTLPKTIFGLVQSDTAFYNKLIEALTDIGFIGWYDELLCICIAYSLVMFIKYDL